MAPLSQTLYPGLTDTGPAHPSMGKALRVVRMVIIPLPQQRFSCEPIVPRNFYPSMYDDIIQISGHFRQFIPGKARVLPITCHCTFFMY